MMKADVFASMKVPVKSGLGNFTPHASITRRASIHCVYFPNYWISRWRHSFREAFETIRSYLGKCFHNESHPNQRVCQGKLM